LTSAPFSFRIHFHFEMYKGKQKTALSAARNRNIQPDRQTADGNIATADSSPKSNSFLTVDGFFTRQPDEPRNGAAIFGVFPFYAASFAP